MFFFCGVCNTRVFKRNIVVEKGMRGGMRTILWHDTDFWIVWLDYTADFFRHFNISANTKCSLYWHKTHFFFTKGNLSKLWCLIFVVNKYIFIYLSKYYTTWSQYKINIILLVSVISKNIYKCFAEIRWHLKWTNIGRNFMDESW